MRKPRSLARGARGALAWVLLSGLAMAPGALRAEDAGVADPLETPSGMFDYRIGVEDVLRVFVLEDELLRNGTILRVRPDGKIGFPYAKGSIVAAGQTTEELEDEIGNRLAPYIREPTVTVIVEEVNSFQVYVLGEVNEPGVISVRRPLKILQVLAISRGLTEFADKGKIQLVRQLDGREVRYRLDYKKMLEGDVSQNPWVRPEDTVLVP